MMKKFFLSIFVFLFSVLAAQAQIARNGVSTGLGENDGNLSWTHTTGGSDRYLVIGCKHYADNDITGVTYNGVAMTQIRGYVAFTGGIEDANDQIVFGLVNPASGANTVSVSRATSAYDVCDAVSYEGVSQTGQPEATAENTISGTNTELTLTVTVATANSWLVAGCASNYNGDSFTAGSGTTEVQENTFLPGLHALFDSNGALGTGSQSLVCARGSGSNALAGIVLVLAPASGGGGGATKKSLLLLGVGGV